MSRSVQQCQKYKFFLAILAKFEVFSKLKKTGITPGTYLNMIPSTKLIVWGVLGEPGGHGQMDTQTDGCTDKTDFTIPLQRCEVE